MGINLYSKRILKFLGTSLIIFCTFSEINSINKQINAEKNLIAATEKDLFLYRQMGASYLCIASKAEVDFKKSLGIASATFANVIIGKHGGFIKDLGDENSTKKVIQFRYISNCWKCIKICPESVPNDIKTDYEKKLKELLEKN